MRLTQWTTHGMKRISSRRGAWPALVRRDLDLAGLNIARQLQRAGRQLHHREVKTPHSDIPLPLPDVSVAALTSQAQMQTGWQETTTKLWHDSGLVITAKYGTPYEPRSFNRH